MASNFLTGHRCARFWHTLLPLVLVLLLAGQRHVLGEGVAAAAVAGAQEVIVDAKGDMEAVMSSKSQQEGVAVGVGAPEDTPETSSAISDKQQVEQSCPEQSCPDVTPVTEERDLLKAELVAVEARSRAEQQSCVDVTSLVTQEQEELKAKIFAAEEKIQSLQEETEANKLEHQSELSSCGGSSAVLQTEVEALKGEVGKLGGVLERAGGEEGIKELMSAAGAAAEAKRRGDAAEKEAAEAVLRAAETKIALEGNLDVAQKELAGLRSKLSSAESRESEARQEAGKHAQANEEVGRVLKRTASELKMAQKPREVSVSAIFADVKRLFDDLVLQSKDARDDIMARASEHLEEARKFIQPHLKHAVEVATPLWQKTVAVTAPQRAQASEAYAIYRGKFDVAVGVPATEKWLSAKAESLKVMEVVMSKWKLAEAALMQKLISAGVSEEQALKACKFCYIGFMASAAVVFLLYLGGTVLNYLIMPVVCRVLRLVMWVVKLPFRILFLPIRLVFWVLMLCFGLAFGSRSTARTASKPVAGVKRVASTKAHANAGR